MTKEISALISGIIFGIGLAISGMVNPAKVAGFLDIAGQWDPSLAFVMGGALAVTGLANLIVLRLPNPMLEPKFHLPTKKDLDSRLLIGSGLFGVGWGIGGICPGPGLTSLAFGDQRIFVFVAAMVVGSLAYGIATRPSSGGVTQAG